MQVLKSARKLGLIALAAATYSMVAGGPFGLEEIVGHNGYTGAILILCITPLLWAVPAALMVSELASALPETGGSYIWVRRALGPFWGFQESWLTFAGSIFDMAIYPILFSAYLAHLLPSLGKGNTPLVIGVSMIAACVVINLLGTRFVGEGSIIFVLLVLAPFGFLIWRSLSFSHSGAVPPALTKTDIMGGILIAMWNYMGFDNASTIAGDVRNATLTYSRAMLVSLTVVVLTYIVPVLAVAHTGLPLSAWETGSWVNIAAYFGGQRLGLVMTAAGVLATLSTFNALVLSLSRLPYAMARDGFLPKIFATENSMGAPWIAILACALLWALAMSLGFERTVMLDVLLTGLSILLEFAALIALRIKEPHLPRPFRVPGGPVGLAFLVTPPFILILISCVRNHAERIGSLNALTVGLGLVFLGAAFYLCSKLSSAKSPDTAL
jgi:amino acid transporter